SILIGAVLVSLADTIGRVIIQPSEIPTGIVVAIIGAPYFLYLLSNSKS
ncbi:iron chelate uptake ABC transporter family permease subunit, partial [Clostridium botulinum]